jgi:hypothetical protein
LNSFFVSKDGVFTRVNSEAIHNSVRLLQHLFNLRVLSFHAVPCRRPTAASQFNGVDATEIGERETAPGFEQTPGGSDAVDT